MGCVNTKLSPSRNERWKRDHGYGSQNRAAKHTSRGYYYQKPLSDKVQHRISTSRTAENGGGGVREEAGGERLAPGAERDEVGNISRRFEDKKIGKDVYVGAWPKWLVDNIPAHVLDKLVPKSADCYEKLAKIGRGTYSNVYKAREKAAGKIVAMKKVRFDTSDAESIKFMAREIMILQKLDHPNVIKLEGIATSRMQYSLYLVFDYMQSDLTRVITRPGEKLTEPQIKCYMQQLLSGLQHCHERGVMHRDVKASNLLIDKKGMLKVADFGLANSFDLKPQGPFTNRVVTLWYRAPELLLGSTDYGFAIDLWSAGCLLAEMFLGKPIMPGRTEVEQMHMIFKLCGSPTEDYWKKLKLMTSYRPPNYKPNYDEIFRAFPPSSIGLLTTLLDLDPNYRGTAASALQSEFFKTSPLPCPPSALPVIFKEKDERSHPKGRKKHRSSKKGQIPQPSNATRSEKNKIAAGQQVVRNSESSKEKKNVEGSMSDVETGNSLSGTSSNSKQYTTEGSLNTSLTLSPVFLSSGEKRSPRTEAHPNALKNVKNYSSYLQAMMNGKEGSDPAQFRRSFSLVDYRFDPDKLSNLIELNKRLGNRN
ncbi:probable serine/threonine-protein kinase At1g54610 [Neltuma alba]|uniref:probable serine/threonine-protein kinase At1g54610 n=1 Tax=Neltuma alba TaxID=207710 RepID=UPI0010A4A9DD|nr:probable serine/threonine-protein kinase At1g54610 [Prosopis alba]